MDADDTHSVSPDLLRRLYPDAPSWQIGKRAPEEQQLATLAEIRSQQLVGALLSGVG